MAGMMAGKLAVLLAGKKEKWWVDKLVEMWDVELADSEVV